MGTYGMQFIQFFFFQSQMMLTLYLKIDEKTVCGKHRQKSVVKVNESFTVG